MASLVEKRLRTNEHKEPKYLFAMYNLCVDVSVCVRIYSYITTVYAYKYKYIYT